MDRLYFRKAVEVVVHKKLGAKARYQFVDAVQMAVIGVISGATAMTQIVMVWAGEVLRNMSGWDDVPVDTSLDGLVKSSTMPTCRHYNGK